MSLRVGKRVVVKKVEHADHDLKRFLGLMFRKGFDGAMVFHLDMETTILASVHMLFMRFPIDVLFLDSKKRVVDKARLRPWALNYTPKRPARFVVEMRAGRAKGIKLGDRVSW